MYSYVILLDMYVCKYNQPTLSCIQTWLHNIVQSSMLVYPRVFPISIIVVQICCTTRDNRIRRVRYYKMPKDKLLLSVSRITRAHHSSYRPPRATHYLIQWLFQYACYSIEKWFQRIDLKVHYVVIHSIYLLCIFRIHYFLLTTALVRWLWDMFVDILTNCCDMTSNEIFYTCWVEVGLGVKFPNTRMKGAGTVISATRNLCQDTNGRSLLWLWRQSHSHINWSYP